MVTVYEYVKGWVTCIRMLCHLTFISMCTCHHSAYPNNYVDVCVYRRTVYQVNMNKQPRVRAHYNAPEPNTRVHATQASAHADPSRTEPPSAPAASRTPEPRPKRSARVGGRPPRARAASSSSSHARSSGADCLNCEGTAEPARPGTRRRRRVRFLKAEATDGLCRAMRK